MRGAMMAIVLIIAGTAGCLGGFPATIPVVLVEDRIEVGEGEGYQGELGPHCADARYQGMPMEVHINSYRLRDRPQFVLLRQYVVERGAISTIGGDLATNWSDDKSGMFRLAAPIGADSILANVTWGPGGIRVDGVDLVAGTAHERRYAYTAQNVGGGTRDAPPRGTGHINETMRFTLHPDTRVTWDDGRGRICM